MVKGKTIEISATSRVAIKLRDNFYTVEASEKRSIPEESNMDEEWTDLWNSVNTVVDKQAEDIYSTFANKK